MISGSFLRASVAAIVLAGVASPIWAQALNQGDSLRASTAPVTGTSTPIGAAAPTPLPKLTPEMRGDIYMARKMFREAIDKFRECPPSASTTNKIGIAFHQLLQLDQAKKNYEAAVKLDPKFSQAINNLGTVYYSQKNYGKAMKCYRKALKLTPSSASIWVNLGSGYFAKHNLKRAAECYDKAMELDPMVFEHRSSYGTLLQERSVDDRAKFHLYLAKAYAQRGEKDKALVYLRKALEEGLKERKKIPEMPEFASLRTDQAFKDLLIQDPKPL
jgi:tetratricopeptide (TPR) repeat protein